MSSLEKRALQSVQSNSSDTKPLDLARRPSSDRKNDLQKKDLQEFATEVGSKVAEIGITAVYTKETGRSPGRVESMMIKRQARKGTEKTVEQFFNKGAGKHLPF
jgi:hypothetical protein